MEIRGELAGNFCVKGGLPSGSSGTRRPDLDGRIYECTRILGGAASVGVPERGRERGFRHCFVLSGCLVCQFIGAFAREKGPQRSLVRRAERAR